METIERISSMVLEGVSFNFSYSGALGADPFDEINDNECKDCIDGNIEYFDADSFEEDEIDTFGIGRFNCEIIYGSEEKVYNALEYGGSITDVRYQDEIFKIKHTPHGTQFIVREEYEELLPEIYENKFMILERVEVKEFFRGHGVITKLIPFLSRTFSCPILIKPYPLQYEGEGKDNTKNFKNDLRKVVESYEKCGFVRPYPKSEFMIKW